MRILGIDPGIAITGYGIIESKGNSFKVINYDCIKTSPNIPISKRLKVIYERVSKTIRKFKPDEIAIEELFFAKNLKTAINVSQARGVIILAMVKNGIVEFNGYTPLQVKMALVGYGKADKKQVQQMVKVILNLKSIPASDDVADALAVAICHANTNRKLR